MTYDENEARALGLERSNRQLAEEVRNLSGLLNDVAELRANEARTRKIMRTIVVGFVAALLIVTAVVASLLLTRVNNLIDDRRESVRAACTARNQQNDNLREHFATLAMRDPKNTRVWTELARAYKPSDVDCSRI